MNNSSNQGNPSLPIHIQYGRSGNPSNSGSVGDQAGFENPQNDFYNQAGNFINYSSMPDHYHRSEPLSLEQMIARSNRFNVPYSNEGSQLNYPHDSNHGSRRENLQVPASLLDISSLNQYANLDRLANYDNRDRLANYDNRDRQPNFEYFPSGESRQSRLGQDVFQARDQFTNPRRDSSLSQISSQQSGYIGSIPSIEENIRQAQQIIDLHEQTARRVQAQNRRREGQSWI